MSLSGLLEVWAFLRWFPLFVLRRIFTSKRLPDLILIDAVAKENAFEVNLGEHPYYRASLKFINLAPKPVILDRAKIKVCLPGVSIDYLQILTNEIGPSEVKTISIEGEISEGKANTIARLLPHERDSAGNLIINAEFKCSLHDFKKEYHQLDRVHVCYSNQDTRLKKNAPS